MPVPRQRFTKKQDWYDYLGTPDIDVSGDQLRNLRLACYKDIEKLRGRPLLVYATQFVDVILPPDAPISISLGDVDGFTDLINSIPNKNREIDILIHSPGGSPDATERIVNLLRPRFETVNFLVPHSAYSAATMMALAGNQVVMHPSAILGPIDPQINGVPARSIKRGFDKIRDKIKEEGPESLPAYIPLIEKYTIELLELCEDSEKLSKELVAGWLGEYMLPGEKNKQKISDTVEYLASYDTHLLHSRPLTTKKLAGFGLDVVIAEDGLKDLMWEAYVLIDGFFSVSPFVKLFESTKGVSWGKQFAPMTFVQTPQIIQTPGQ